jgi:hypothetical protein
MMMGKGKRLREIKIAETAADENSTYCKYIPRRESNNQSPRWFHFNNDQRPHGGLNICNHSFVSVVPGIVAPRQRLLRWFCYYGQEK